MRRLILLVIFIYLGCLLEAQPCAYRDSFQPSFVNACATYTIGPYVGWAQYCTGSGYTGSGSYTVLKVCTDSLSSCINLSLSPGTYTGHAEITLFTNCWSNSPSGYVSNSYKCISNTSGIYSTEGLGLAPNTCYVAAIWTKDTGTFQVCRQLSARPADDTCLGATPVPFVSTYYNTSCYTHDTAANMEKNHSCVAGALKKSRWFKYTLTCDTFAKFYFTNMTCTGGSSGYNVSYYTGTCGSLNYLSCSSGTGGSFNTTISGLSIGTTIYIVVNGNHGANCGFSLRADTPVITKYSTQNIALCSGKSVTIGGIVRMAAGTYKDTIWKSCGSATIIDSIRTINLTIKPISIGNLGTGFCQGGRIFWNGRMLYNSGVYRDTFLKANGCDSIINLFLNVRPLSYKTIDSQICQGQSVLFNGLWRTNSGTYLDTLKSASNCDSFITFNLRVNPVTTTHIYDTICQGGSKFFNGINRTVSGIYRDTFLSYKNCDSFVVLNLFVRPVFSKIIDTAICSGNSVFFKGQNRTITGVYRDTLVNIFGCDSIVTLNLTVNSSSTKLISLGICQPGFILFKGQNRTTTGIYRDTLVNASGCDSIVILNLDVRSISNTTINLNICQGESVFFKGQNRTTTAIYRDTLKNIVGCDSFVVLNLTVNPIKTTNLNIGICAGNSYFFKGQNRSTTGTYRDTLKTTLNCDSVIVLNLTVLPVKTRTIDTAICFGNSVFFKGQNRTTTGVYHDTITNPFPTCDSVITLNLSVKNTSTRNLYDTICQGQSIIFKGVARTTTGIYRDTLVNALGCDSFVLLNLLVKALPNVNAGLDASRVNCITDSVQLGTTTIAGQTYSWIPALGLSDSSIAQPWAKPLYTTSYVVEVILNATGCKLKDTVTITVLPSTVSTSIRKYLRTCRGASGQTLGGTPTAIMGTAPYSYLWTPNIHINSNTIANPVLANTQQGNYTYILQVTDGKGCIVRDTAQVIVDSLPLNAAGRDTGLCRNSPFTVGKLAQSKINYLWSPTTNLSSGILANPSFNSSIAGFYQYVLTIADSSNTCLLRDTLSIQVNSEKYDTLRPNICLGQSFFFNGAPRTASGTYYQNAITTKGCDSLVVLHLTVNNISVKTIDSQICQGKTVFFKGQNRTTTGMYRDTFLNTKNCDSIVTLNLTVNPTPTTNINLTICQGQSVNFNGLPRTTSGVYRDTLSTYKNCDSIIILQLTVSPKSFKIIDTGICKGKTYFFKGQNRSTNLTLTDTLVNALGCDSIVTLLLTMKDTSSYTIRDTICKNSIRLFNGNFLNVTGVYKDTLANAAGCDSFIYLNLWVKSTSTTFLYDTICSNGSSYFKGRNLNMTGTYTDTLVNGAGCDSFVILHLVVHPTTSSARTINICQGQSYFFNGRNLMTSGIYYDTLVNKKGCDSLITLTLVVNPLPIADAGVDQTRVNCDGDSVILGAAPDPAYSYLWTPNSGIQSQTIANPYSKTTVKTTYALLVTNVVTGCRAYDTVVVDILQSQLSGSAIARNLTCFNDFSGRLDINPANGYPPYSYRINSFNNYINSNVISRLPAFSSATYTIKDSKGCLFSGAFVITQPDSISIKTILKSDLKCYNDSSGRIAVSAVGGIPPYSYAWNRSLSVDSLAEKLADGLHVVTVSDGSLCTKPHKIILTQPTKLILLDTIKYLNPCFGDTLGKLRAIVSGGIAPYTYKWSNGRSESLIDKLVAGVYKLTIEDGNLCEETFHIRLIDPGKLIIDSILTQKLNCNDNGSIRIVASAGTKPYRYSISAGSTFKVDSVFNVRRAGEYKVQVIDKNLCIAKDSINIGYQALIKIQIEPSERIIQLGEQVQLGFRVLEGDSSTIQSLRWSPGIGLSCSDCEAPLVNTYSSETYMLNIGYAGECETVGRSKIVVESKDELYIPNSFNPYSGTLENRTFKIYSNNLLRATLAIYNRWGEEVFRSLEPQRIGWNGEYKGRVSATGVYYYHLDITYLDGRRLHKNGNINLIY